MPRTIITGGVIVNADATTHADLIIENERIAGIMQDAPASPDDRVIDAAGLLVLPGLVDAHTHIQLDTGIYQTADDWLIGTKAAAAGGVTTVIDFATQFPGQTVDEAIDNRLKETAPAMIDYGLHCMITDLPHGKEDDMLARLVERGVPSFKIYTTYRPNYYMDDATILRLMSTAYRVGGLVLVHAENDSMVTDATARLVDQGKTGWQYHGKGRPVIAEWEAIQRLAYFADLTNASVYIVHCTSSNSIDIIAEARQQGTAIYCETCPQYLLLDERVYDGPHPERYILQPPLRNKIGQDALWHDLKQTINVVSTDSCDYTIKQKTEHKTFTQTPGGLPGVETLLPLLYTYGVGEGRISLMDLTRLTSLNPARIFGRAPQKGSIQIGADADVALYDPAPEWTLSHTDLHYVSGYSPYEGMRIKGRVKMTISRGDVVYEYGKDDPFEGVDAGRGKFVAGEI